MNSTPTPAAVLAAVLAGRDCYDVYAEDGTSHHGTIALQLDTNGAADAVIRFETTDVITYGSGTFLIAVRRLDLESPAERAVADAGGLGPEVDRC